MDPIDGHVTWEAWIICCFSFILSFFLEKLKYGNLQKKIIIRILLSLFWSKNDKNFIVVFEDGKEVQFTPENRDKLDLAYAITIHKSQGVTLDSAVIDAGKDVFEDGQTYVALSRVKTLEGIFLIALDIRAIKANKKVEGYYASLWVREYYCLYSFLSSSIIVNLTTICFTLS